MDNSLHESYKNLSIWPNNDTVKADGDNVYSKKITDVYIVDPVQLKEKHLSKCVSKQPENMKNNSRKTREQYCTLF